MGLKSIRRRLQNLHRVAFRVVAIAQRLVEIAAGKPHKAGFQRPVQRMDHAFVVDPRLALVHHIFVGDFEVDLTRSHSMAGNPSRFESGTVTISRDDTWRQQLPPSVQRLVTLLTWPLARRYGY